MDRRNNSLTLLFVAWARVYKLILSPFLVLNFGGACKYNPTCSEYAHDAVIKYGFIKGLWLSLNRLIRCNPLSEGGYDPA